MGPRNDPKLNVTHLSTSSALTITRRTHSHYTNRSTNTVYDNHPNRHRHISHIVSLNVIMASNPHRLTNIRVQHRHLNLRSHRTLKPQRHPTMHPSATRRIMRISPQHSMQPLPLAASQRRGQRKTSRVQNRPVRRRTALNRNLAGRPRLTLLRMARPAIDRA